MKKLMLLMGMLAALAVAGCSSPERKIQQGVEATKKVLPIEVAGIGVISDVSFNEANKNLIMVTDVYDDMVQIESIRSNPALSQESCMLNIASNGREQNKKDVLLNNLVEIGGFVTYVYRDILTGNAAMVNLSTEQIREALEYDYTEEELFDKLLDIEVARENSQYPVEIEQGMFMQSVSREDGYLVYHVVLDENDYNIDEMNAAHDLLRSNMEAEMASPEMKEILYRLSKVGNGLRYTYTGDKSGKSVDITFTPEDVARHAPDKSVIKSSLGL